MSLPRWLACGIELCCFELLVVACVSCLLLLDLGLVLLYVFVVGLLLWFVGCYLHALNGGFVIALILNFVAFGFASDCVVIRDSYCALIV